MAKAPTAEQKRRWDKIAQLPCMVCNSWPVELHHALTGGGGRKNHDLMLPLCFAHHRGQQGIHTVGRKRWVNNYGSEQSMLDKIDALLQDG